MKLETFIDKLHSVGFIQGQSEGISNWYSHHISGTSIFVGIMAYEIDYLGHIPIDVNYVKDGDDEEIEKTYMTTVGAWKAINKLIKSLEQ